MGLGNDRDGVETGAVDRPRCLVVVPCYEEEGRLDVERFVALAATDGIVFVDDGSTDGTRGVLADVAARAPHHVEVLHLERNVGKGEAVRAGVLHAIEAGADVVGYLDADLATPVDGYADLRSALVDRDLDAVFGSRVELLGWSVRRAPVRHYLGRVFATVASWVLQLPIYDTQCGAKVFRVTPALRTAVARPFTSRWAFDVELIARLTAEPTSSIKRIEEYPLREWADVAGTQLNPRQAAGALADLGRIWWRYRAAVPRGEGTRLGRVQDSQQ